MSEYREHELTIVNPASGDGVIRVHRAGCGDVAREMRRSYGSGVEWTVHARDFHDVVLEVYGPNSGSFFAEHGYTIEDWQMYASDIRLMPCAAELPHDLPEITTDDRAARYGDDRTAPDPA